MIQDMIIIIPITEETRTKQTGKSEFYNYLLFILIEDLCTKFSVLHFMLCAPVFVEAAVQSNCGRNWVDSAGRRFMAVALLQYKQPEMAPDICVYKQYLLYLPPNGDEMQ